MSRPHRPRKRFGQHFLADESVVNQIVSAFAPMKSDQVIEIGPGEGVLTKHFIEVVKSIDAIEIDKDLAVKLKRDFQNCPNFTLHSADALTFPLSQIARANRLRVIGNLPYNISTPLLVRLFDQLPLISDMMFMLQKEVVDRICAEVNTKAL